MAAARARAGMLEIKTAGGTQKVAYEVRPTVSRIGAQRLVEQKTAVVVLTQFIAPATGSLLAEGGIQYVDLAGNCHLALGRFFVHVEGKRPEPDARRERGFGAAGYQVLFAILARPELLRAPERQFATEAGLARAVVGDTLERLLADGTIGQAGRGGRKLLQREALMERWVAGYEDVVRPRLLIGRFRPGERDPVKLERRLRGTLKGAEWWWGGAAAAYRLVRRYRGEHTVVHLPRMPADVPRQFKAQPDPEGPLILLGLPGRLAGDGPVPHVVHPLLVYAELLHGANDRAREAAGLIRAKVLE
jgi:hypothetical protein